MLDIGYWTRKSAMEKCLIWYGVLVTASSLPVLQPLDNDPGTGAARFSPGWNRRWWAIPTLLELKMMVEQLHEGEVEEKLIEMNGKEFSYQDRYSKILRQIEMNWVGID